MEVEENGSNNSSQSTAVAADAMPDDILRRMSIFPTGSSKSLLWAVTLAYLTPVQNNSRLFADKFKKLFGRKEIDDIQYVKQLINNINLSFINGRDDNFIEKFYADCTLKHLVDKKLYNRLKINKVNHHDDNTPLICDKDAIEALQNLLFCKITLITNFENVQVYINESIDSALDGHIILFKNKTHYDFCLVKGSRALEAVKNENLEQTLTYLTIGVEDINYCGRDGISIFNYCQRTNNAKLMELCKNQLINRNIRSGSEMPFNSKGQTALHMASAEGNVKIAHKLFSHFGQSPDKLPSFLETKTKDEEQTALHLAVERNRLNIVKCLLVKGADVNARDVSFYTPLHYAATNGFLSIAKLLVENKANINCKDDKGQTPLHIAAIFGNLKIIKSLLKSEIVVDVNALDNVGRSALTYAVHGGNKRIVSVLLKNKANVHFRWLHTAINLQKWKVAKYLIPYYADVAFVAHDYDTIKDLLRSQKFLLIKAINARLMLNNPTQMAEFHDILRRISEELSNSLINVKINTIFKKSFQTIRDKNLLKVSAPKRVMSGSEQKDDYLYLNKSKAVKKKLPSKSEDFRLNQGAADYTYNILLVGEVGVGKSTFINAFSNYLQFETFFDALIGVPQVRIPGQFLLCDDNYHFTEIKFNSEKIPKIRGDINNYYGDYDFETNNYKLKIIEIPGIDKYRRDHVNSRLNLHDLLEEFPESMEVNEIFILLKIGPETISSNFVEFIEQYLNPKYKDVVNVIFTHCHSSIYHLEDIPNIRANLISQIFGTTKVSNKMYCMDNVPFKILMAVQNQFDVCKSDFEKCKLIWTESKNVIKKLIEDVKSNKKTIKLMTALNKEPAKNLQSGLVNANEENITQEFANLEIQVDFKSSSGSKNSQTEMSNLSIPEVEALLRKSVHAESEFLSLAQPTGSNLKLTPGDQSELQLSAEVTEFLLRLEEQERLKQMDKPTAKCYSAKPEIFSIANAYCSSIAGKEYNIILLGESGAGKSTFINVFWNYLKFGSLDEARNGKAEVLIPDHPDQCILFDGDVQRRNDLFGAGEEDNCTAYEFAVDNFVLRIINISGIGITRDPNHDTLHLEGVLRFLSNFEELHAICIVLKANSVDLSASFASYIGQLCAQLPHKVSENLVFILSNSRKTLNCPENTPIDRIFCLDNVPFQFLIASQNNPNLSEIDFDTYELSWRKSVQEIKRLINYIVERGESRLNTKPSRVNVTRQIIIKLAPIVSTLAKNIQMNIQLLNRRKDEINNCNNDEVKFEQLLNVPRVSLKINKLVQPRTASARPDCRRAYSAWSRRFYHNLDEGHPCYLTEGSTEVIGQICLICGWSYRLHWRIYYEIEEENTQIIVEQSTGCRSKEETAIAAKTMIKKLESEIDEYKLEQENLCKCMAKLTLYLKQNAIVVQDDLFKDHLLRRINVLERIQTELFVQERKSHDNVDIVKRLEDVLHSYETQKAVQVERVSVQEIFNCVEEMCNMERIGINFKMLITVAETALHECSTLGRAETALRLLKCGANVEAVDSKKRTALHLAAENGHVEMVRLLLEYKSEANAVDLFGQTALCLATDKGHSDVVEYLLSNGADPNIKMAKGNSALHLAADQGYVKIVEAILKHDEAEVDIVNDKRQRPLHMAATKGHTEVVQLLLNTNASVNVSTEEGSSPLHFASFNGHVKTARLLLNCCATVNFPNKDGWTALHCAANNGHLEMVRLLLSCRANVNATNVLGQTALNLATTNDVIVHLLAKGAERNIQIKANSAIFTAKLPYSKKAGTNLNPRKFLSFHSFKK